MTHAQTRPPRITPRPSNPMMKAVGEVTLHADEAKTFFEHIVGRKGLVAIAAGFALYGFGLFQNRDPETYARNMRQYYASIPMIAHTAQPGDSLQYCARSQGFETPPMFTGHDARAVYASFVRSHPLNSFSQIDTSGALPAGALVHLPALWPMNCQPHER